MAKASSVEVEVVEVAGGAGAGGGGGAGAGGGAGNCTTSSKRMSKVGRLRILVLHTWMGSCSSFVRLFHPCRLQS